MHITLVVLMGNISLFIVMVYRIYFDIENPNELLITAFRHFNIQKTLVKQLFKKLGVLYKILLILYDLFKIGLFHL